LAHAALVHSAGECSQTLIDGTSARERHSDIRIERYDQSAFVVTRSIRVALRSAEIVLSQNFTGSPPMIPRGIGLLFLHRVCAHDV
jgi:hypothetical protein